MLDGLIALFTSGLIFNPALLLGALSGILCYVFFDMDRLILLIENYHLYLLFFVLCFIFVYFFKKNLKDNLIDTDWKETFKNVVKHFILMCFSFFCGILFASFFDYSDKNLKPDKDDAKYSEISEVMSVKKQAEDMMKNSYSMFDSIEQKY